MAAVCVCVCVCVCACVCVRVCVCVCRKGLDALVANHFPLKSSEYSPGSTAYHEYITAVEKVCAQVCMCGDTCMLFECVCVCVCVCVCSYLIYWSSQAVLYYYGY